MQVAVSESWVFRPAVQELGQGYVDVEGVGTLTTARSGQSGIRLAIRDVMH